jgi:hypothetical protein
MFSGPPLPLSPDFPLQSLVTLTPALAHLGAWVRGRTRDLPLSLTDYRCQVLISGDLGVLLRRCQRVAVRQGTQPVVLEANRLIEWRALQVITGMPYLLPAELLREVFPGAQPRADGFEVPICDRAPEEVLADCLIHAIPVAKSQVVYRAGS